MRELSADAVAALRLPARQLEVLKGIAGSETTKSLAFALKISAKTVEYHRAKLMRRLRIFDVAGLTRFAVRSGLIEA